MNKIRKSIFIAILLVIIAKFNFAQSRCSNLTTYYSVDVSLVEDTLKFEYLINFVNQDTIDYIFYYFETDNLVDDSGNVIIINDPMVYRKGQDDLSSAMELERCRWISKLKYKILKPNDIMILKYTEKYHNRYFTKRGNKNKLDYFEVEFVIKYFNLSILPVKKAFDSLIMPEKQMSLGLNIFKPRVEYKECRLCYKIRNVKGDIIVFDKKVVNY